MHYDFITCWWGNRPACLIVLGNHCAFGWSSAYYDYCRTREVQKESKAIHVALFDSSDLYAYRIRLVCEYEVRHRSKNKNYFVMILLYNGNGLELFLFYIIAILFGPPLVLFILALMEYKKDKERTKVFLIAGFVYLILGLGFCLSM